MGGKKGFMEIDYGAMEERWVLSVAEHSQIAFRCGPPNWMVLREQRQGEEFQAVAERVKAMYFNADGSPKLSTVKELSTADVHLKPQWSTVDNVRMSTAGEMST